LAERRQVLKAKGDLPTDQIEVRAESDMNQLEHFMRKRASVKINFDDRGQPSDCQVIESSGDAADDAEECKSAMDQASKIISKLK